MEEHNEQNKKILGRDTLKWVIIGMAGFVIVGLIFGAGMFVGGMKARFSYKWAESYHKNFAGPQEGFFGDWRRAVPLPGDFLNSHGVFGQILELRDNGFVIKSGGEVEKVILFSDETIIEKGRQNAEKDELKVGSQVVIIGSPDEQGQIEARLIRIFDGESGPMPYKGPRFPLF